MSGDGTSSAPNADNTELPAQVPDPMTDDLDAGEVATDATAEDAHPAGADGDRDIHGEPDQVT